MKHKIDFSYFGNILSSKELNPGQFAFLKSDSEPILHPVAAPQTYLCDILLDHNPQLEEFIKRFMATDTARKALATPDEPPLSQMTPFTCTVIQNDFTPLPEENFNTRDAFETMLRNEIRNGEGIWGWLSDSTLIAVITGNHEDGKKTIDTLLNYAQKHLISPSHAGAATFPHAQDHSSTTTGSSTSPADIRDGCTSPEQTVHNAIKALDHAAFLGSGSVAFFDDVTQNIFGDRLYQLQKNEEASAEYHKGLELNPENINLRNSLG